MSTQSFLAAIAVLICAAPGRTCDVGGADLFQPNSENFIQHLIDQEIREKPPAPLVKVVSVTRGKTDNFESCEDAGIVRLSLSLPTSSGFSISELGFYFRVVSGTLPDEIFPAVPLSGPVSGRNMELVFPWLDGDPRRQKSLKARTEVFPVAHNLTIEPSTQFELRAAAGRAHKK